METEKRKKVGSSREDEKQREEVVSRAKRMGKRGRKWQKD